MNEEQINILEKKLSLDIINFNVINQNNSNINLIIDSRDGRYFVKIMGSENEAGRNLELKILRKLKNISNGVKAVESATDSPIIYDGKPVVIYKYIEGRHIEAQDITDDFITRLSRYQATMHDTLKIENSSGRVRFMPYDLSFIEDFNMSKDNLAGRAKHQIENTLTKNNFHLLEKTIIHDDMSMENIIKSNNEVYLIDFSDAHLSYRISDIANTIKELIIDNFGLNKLLINSYIKGYSKQAQTPLVSDEIKLLSSLYLRRALFMYSYYSGLPIRNDSIVSNIEKQKTTLTKLMR